MSIERCAAAAELIVLTYGLPEGEQRKQMQSELERACLEGTTAELDWDRYDPRPNKPLREGAIRGLGEARGWRPEQIEDSVELWRKLRAGEQV